MALFVIRALAGDRKMQFRAIQGLNKWQYSKKIAI